MISETKNAIWTVRNRKEKHFLRKKTRAFDFSQYTKKEIDELILRMKKAMHLAQGVGLSANQIGLDVQVFIAETEEENGGKKFYAVFNPKIEKVSKEMTPLEEGCLSVPEVYGEVLRPSHITISGSDKHNRPIKLKAWGLLAKIFQHEIDHLNGVLFIDKATELHEIPKSERLKDQKEKA